MYVHTQTFLLIIILSLLFSLLSAISSIVLEPFTSSSAMDPQEYFKSLNNKTVQIIRARNGLRLKSISKLSRPAQDQLTICRERWEKYIIY
jgi:hypothetical protein